MVFFSKKSTEEKMTCALFDIGSGSVGGSIVQYGEDVPVIEASLRQTVRFQKEFQFEYFYHQILQTLDHVAGQLAKSNVKSPQHIFLMLRSPWVEAQTRFIFLEKKEPFRFTQKIADSLIGHELQKIMNGTAQHADHVHQGYDVLENRTMRVRLHGYTISNPLDKMTLSAELSLYVSFLERTVRLAIEERIAKYFHAEITVHSFPFVSFSVLSKNTFHEASYLVFDIGGEVTELLLVRDHVVTQTLTLPRGTHHLYRRILTGMNVAETEVFSMMRMYRQGILAEHLRYELDHHIADEKDVWRKMVQEILHRISLTSLLPDTIFMYAENEMLSVYLQALSDEHVYQYHRSLKPFTLIPVTKDTLQGKVRNSLMNHDAVHMTHALYGDIVRHFLPTDRI